MRRIFSKDISVEILCDGNSIEAIATVQFSTTPYRPAVIMAPVERCHEAEGGEIDDLEITAFYFPARKSILSSSGDVHQSACERVDMVLPPALAEWIVANVSSDTLADAVDFDDGPDPDDARDERDEMFGEYADCGD